MVAVRTNVFTKLSRSYAWHADLTLVAWVLALAYIERMTRCLALRCEATTKPISLTYGHHQAAPSMTRLLTDTT